MTAHRRRPSTSRTSVSGIVPTLNSERTIEACVASIAGQTDVDIEVVVVDNHSADRTVELSREWTETIEIAGPERCAQRNHGSRLASGDVLMFIDSDMVLEPGIAREAVAAFDRDVRLGALVIPERAFGSGPWIGARSLEKDTYLGDPTVEAARIFRRDVFEAVGRYDEAMIAGEDWDLADRVAQAGYLTGRVDAVVWHDEGRISLPDLFAKKRYYGRTFDEYRLRHGSRRSVGIRRVRPFLRAATHSPLRVASLLVLKSVEAAGFAVGTHDARHGASA